MTCVGSRSPYFAERIKILSKFSIASFLYFKKRGEQYIFSACVRQDTLELAHDIRQTLLILLVPKILYLFLNNSYVKNKYINLDL